MPKYLVEILMVGFVVVLFLAFSPWGQDLFNQISGHTTNYVNSHLPS